MPGLIVRQDFRLRRMASIAGGRGRILDVGCSDLPNRFLHAKEVIGFDKIPTTMPDNYTGFVEGDASSIDDFAPRSSFDAVIAGEVLEHIMMPVDFLKRCADLLCPGGLMLLSTPNPNSPIERFLTITLSRRFFYTPDHVCLYPQRWLVRMMELAGYGDVRLFSGGFPLPLIGLAPFPRPWCHQTIATGIKTGR